MTTGIYKVYGMDGHRQRASFGRSDSFVPWDGKTTVTLLCEDVTGTNDYVLLIITAENEEDVESCFWGQVSDGIFENCRIGEIESKMLKGE